MKKPKPCPKQDGKPSVAVLPLEPRIKQGCGERVEEGNRPVYLRK